jgi:hypothetical protein
MQRLVGQSAALMVGGAIAILILTSLRVGAQWDVSAQPATADQTSNVIDAALAVQPNLQYQGVLLDAANTPKPDGDYSIIFRLYDAATDGAVVWQETQSVIVSGGFFSVSLGQAQSIPSNIFDNKQLFLGVQVGDESEMSPRQQLAVSPYAFWSYSAKVAEEADATNRLRQFRAYGIVNEDGSKHRGFNFTSNRQTIDGELTYRIDISGENYNLNDYVTTVTVVKNAECPGPVIAMTGSTDGDLLVDLFQPNGGRAYCKFHFETLTLN